MFGGYQIRKGKAFYCMRFAVVKECITVGFDRLSLTKRSPYFKYGTGFWCARIVIIEKCGLVKNSVAVTIAWSLFAN